MRIQHNIAAVNHYRQQGLQGKVVSKSMEKLSSGQRINRAADDASGLGISEKMKAQIRGLTQASRNIQDGLSLIDTTESAIGLMQNPNLVRMRELILQAANAPLTGEEHAIIQQEIRQIAEEMDRLERDTEFNTMPVLGPSKIEDDEIREFGAFDIVFFIDDSGSMGENIQLVTDGLSAFMSNIEQYGDVRVGTQSLVKDRPNSHKLTSDYDSVKQYMTNSHPPTGGAIAPYEQMLATLNDPDFGFREGAEKVFIILTDTSREAGEESAKQQLEQRLQAEGVQSYLFGVRFSGETNTYPNDFYERDFNFVTAFTRPATKEEIAEGISPGIADLIIGQTEGVQKYQHDLVFQVGPNRSQHIDVRLFDLRAATLHIKDLEVDTYERAMQSLRRVDQASAQLTNYRTYYGALQNRLEHAQNQVDAAAEQLTNSLSMIRDQDIAKGIEQLTNQQIILQSAQAIGAQVNQQMQGILHLLQ